MTLKGLAAVSAALFLWLAVMPAAAGPAFFKVVWMEREGDWVGVWSPKNAQAADGQYRALWRKGSEQVAADLTIGLTPVSASELSVEVVRTSRNSRCDYSGTLTPADPSGGYPRYWVVLGTYSCSRGPRLNWSARIDVGPPASRDNRVLPSDGPRDERLGRRWREREGDWVGNWVPRNPSQLDGAFEARWHKGNSEWESAFLQIAITPSGQVQVARRGPSGACQYLGTFTDARNVSGTYTCAWERGRPRHDWSATVDE